MSSGLTSFMNLKFNLKNLFDISSSLSCITYLYLFYFTVTMERQVESHKGQVDMEGRMHSDVQREACLIRVRINMVIETRQVHPMQWSGWSVWFSIATWNPFFLYTSCVIHDVVRHRSLSPFTLCNIMTLLQCVKYVRHPWLFLWGNNCLLPLLIN